MQTSGAGGSGAWPAVDHLITDIAPLVPLVNPRVVIVVSRRARNVQWNPQWEVLIDQIWVR